jgi:hypothetical protein
MWKISSNAAQIMVIRICSHQISVITYVLYMNHWTFKSNVASISTLWLSYELVTYEMYYNCSITLSLPLDLMTAKKNQVTDSSILAVHFYCFVFLTIICYSSEAIQTWLGKNKWTPNSLLFSEWRCDIIVYRNMKSQAIWIFLTNWLKIS